MLRHENEIVGYTGGVFDMFHVGHLRILKRARALCDHLIVAVSSDDLVFDLKGHFPIIPLEERMEIVESLNIADEVIVQHSYNKVGAWAVHQFDRLFIGSDHKNDPKWVQFEHNLNGKADVYYLPYTKTVSTTEIRRRVCEQV